MLRSAGNRLKPCAYPYADCGGLVVRGARSYKFQACGQKNQGCGSTSATLGKKSQAFGIYREETGVKKKADLGRYSYCSCGLCFFFFCLPTLMMNSIYIYIIIAPKIFGAMLRCLFRQLSGCAVGIALNRMIIHTSAAYLFLYDFLSADDIQAFGLGRQ